MVYIDQHKGKNLGGMAFSWMDRYEGTATWFGITDYKGRLKPVYYYLQNVWMEDKGLPKSFPDITIVGNWQALNPGESLWLTAAITNGYLGKLDHKWMVYEQDWKMTSPILNSKLDGQYVEIKLPSTPSRIYHYAVDSMGNVITASRPLLIRN